MEQTTERPKLIRIEQESDLGKLVTGNKVNISLDGVSVRCLTYEGVVDGQPAFMELDEGRGINSWRSRTKYLQFENGAVLFNILYTNIKQYPINSKEYQSKLPIIEANN